MQTLPYYGQFALSLAKELKPNIFPKFNLPYMDTPLLWTFSSVYRPFSVRINVV